MQTIFVTYNPGNDFEQTLAVRLQTLGAIHGFRMLMPDRFTNEPVSRETLFRINSSEYFIFFSTSKLTGAVQKEIEAAYEHLHDKSKIVIVYDRVRNINHNLNCTEIFIDSRKDPVQQILEHTIEKIQGNQLAGKNRQDETVNVLGGLLLVGLGLLALNSLVSKK
jgi:hypothetical protein